MPPTAPPDVLGDLAEAGPWELTTAPADDGTWQTTARLGGATLTWRHTAGGHLVVPADRPPLTGTLVRGDGSRVVAHLQPGDRGPLRRFLTEAARQTRPA